MGAAGGGQSSWRSCCWYFKGCMVGRRRGGPWSGGWLRWVVVPNVLELLLLLHAPCTGLSVKLGLDLLQPPLPRVLIDRRRRKQYLPKPDGANTAILVAMYLYEEEVSNRVRTVCVPSVVSVWSVCVRCVQGHASTSIHRYPLSHIHPSISTVQVKAVKPNATAKDLSLTKDDIMHKAEQLGRVALGCC